MLFWWFKDRDNVFITHFERRNTCAKDWGVRMFSCLWPVICHVRIDRVRCSCSPPRSRDAESIVTGPSPHTTVPPLFIKTPLRVWEWNKQMILRLILHNVIRVWLRRCQRLSDCFFFACLHICIVRTGLCYPFLSSGKQLLHLLPCRNLFLSFDYAE